MGADAADHADEHGDDPADARALAAHAEALADGIEAALPDWVVSSVERILVAFRGSVSDEEHARAVEAGRTARAEAGPRVRALLESDIDDQRANPLSIVREAVRYPTEVLRAAGVPPVVRDEFAERRFPEDVFDLSPASFAEVAPELHDLGLTWGAAKAHVHLARRRRLEP